MVRTSVDFPAPFAPMIPTTDPRRTSSDTFFTASTSRTVRSRRPRRTTVLLNVGFFSIDVRYVTDTSSTLIAGRGEAPFAEAEPDAATTPGAVEPLEADGKVTLPRHEEQGTA